MQVQSSEPAVFNLLKLPGPSQGPPLLFTPQPSPPAKPPPPQAAAPPRAWVRAAVGCTGVSRSSPPTRGRASPRRGTSEHLWHDLPPIRRYLPPAGSRSLALEATAPPYGAEPTASQA